MTDQHNKRSVFIAGKILLLKIPMTSKIAASRATILAAYRMRIMRALYVQWILFDVTNKMAESDQHTDPAPVSASPSTPVKGILKKGKSEAKKPKFESGR